MGCGASSSAQGKKKDSRYAVHKMDVKPHTEVEGAPSSAGHVLTIVRAERLKKGDGPFAGDPYVEVQCGGAAAGKTSVRKSKRNPVWHEAIDGFKARKGDKLSFAVKDADVVGKDDLLGAGELEVGGEAGHVVHLRPGPAVLYVRVGAEAAMDAKMMRTFEYGEYANTAIGKDGWQWQHPAAPGATIPSPSIGLRAATAIFPDGYWEDMIRWMAHGPAYQDWMSEDGGVTSDFMGAVSYLRHKDVAERLQQFAEGAYNGTLTRRNDFGTFEMADDCFPRVGRNLLCIEPAKHPFLKKWVQRWLAGAPSRDDILPQAREWLKGREKIQMSDDVRVWVRQIIWRSVFGVELDEAEGVEFGQYCKDFAMAAILPSMKQLLTRGLLGSSDREKEVKDLNARTEKWAVKMEGLLKVAYPEMAGLPAEDLSILGQACVEMFALGSDPSTANVISCGIYVLSTPGMFPEDNLHADNVEQFVYEVTRLFPPVQNFCYWRADGKREMLCINSALRDPDVWGPDAAKFTLKPLELYRQAHCGFVQQSGCPFQHRASKEGDKPGWACPGREFAFTMSEAFLLAIANYNKPGVQLRDVWRVEGEFAFTTQPNWVKEYALTRVPGAEM